MFLTSLTASEGKEEGFGSPRNAPVLPNVLETRPGLEGSVVERCSPSLVLEAGEMKKPFPEHLLRAGQAGFVPRRLTACLLNQGPCYLPLPPLLINSQFKLCLMLSRE